MAEITTLRDAVADLVRTAICIGVGQGVAVILEG
jgi:hypothetical protein